MTRLALSAFALTVGSAVVLADVAVGLVHAQAAPGVPDVLKKSMAYYSTLASYSDTGTMVEDGGGTGREARFTTYFRRASRDFYFDYQPISSRSGAMKFDDTKSRTVLWMFKNQMEKYQQPQNALEAINAENGGQVRGLQSINYETRGVGIMIPSLLYSQAGLASTVRQIEEAEVAGFEEIDKHRCQKITGVAAAYYPSGQRTSIRPVTVWIDVETQLIRRVFEDTPKGYPNGGKYHLTFTFEPQANPTIDDSKFQFKVPAAAR